MNHIEIYTDGSSSIKDKTGGIGVVILFDDQIDQTISKGYFDLKTGQSELLAMYLALKTIEVKNIKTTIYSDSQYAIKSFTEWWKAWEMYNFIGVKNVELLKALKRELEQFTDISFVHIKGHTGNKYNETADKLAHHGRLHNKEESYLDLIKTL